LPDQKPVLLDVVLLYRLILAVDSHGLTTSPSGYFVHELSNIYNCESRVPRDEAISSTAKAEIASLRSQ
ncbi:MAG: hypothetical protein ACOYXY_16295, partial [Thermodesulfobacteriota bacterium]